ncbi:hypothetical protein ACFL52_00760 [Candidatus Margulisiibacteriota bacterium]
MHKKIIVIFLLLAVLNICIYNSQAHAQIVQNTSNKTAEYLVFFGIVGIIFILPVIGHLRTSMSKPIGYVSEEDIEINNNKTMLKAKYHSCNVYEKPGSNKIVDKLVEKEYYEIISSVIRINTVYHLVKKSDQKDFNKKNETENQNPAGFLELFRSIGWPASN